MKALIASSHLDIYPNMKLASMLLVFLFSASLCVSISAASVKGKTTSVAAPVAAQLFRSLINQRTAHSAQRKKGNENFDMEVFKKSIATLEVTYTGSTRSVRGCSGAIIGKKYILFSEECVVASNGEPVLDISSTKTSQGIGLSAIFVPKDNSIGLAVVQLKSEFGADKKVASLSTSIVSSNPIAMVANDGSGSAIQYRYRTYTWCNRMSAAPGSSELFSCATPSEIAVCPANHGTIAFETSDTGPALIGFASGGDCSTMELTGISWIGLVSGMEADLTELMANGGLDAKFTKHV